MINKWPNFYELALANSKSKRALELLEFQGLPGQKDCLGQGSDLPLEA